ncbi:hypothetical protein EBX31_12840, partial [bacterium]|nr:hypothetical protein [bacterium]
TAQAKPRPKVRKFSHPLFHRASIGTPAFWVNRSIWGHKSARFSGLPPITDQEHEAATSSDTGC